VSGASSRNQRFDIFISVAKGTNLTAVPPAAISPQMPHSFLLTGLPPEGRVGEMCQGKSVPNIGDNYTEKTLKLGPTLF
jgi:hypothetical protein